MVRHAKRRDAVRTRESLLQAAFREIHRSGFRGADVDSILRAAGVTKGAMYHHFDSKQALGQAVIEEVIADIMRSKWVAPLEETHNCIDVLIGIVRGTSLLPEHVACGCPLNSLSEEMSPLDAGFRKRTGRIFSAWHQAIANALRDGKASDAVREDVDPKETATFFIAAYEGFISLAKNAQDAGVLRTGQKALVRYLESLRPPRAGEQVAA